MGNELIKHVRRSKALVIMYLANDGNITKRRIKVLAINNNSVIAFCCLRASRRTFKFGNILAVVPVIQKESMVVS